MVRVRIEKREESLGIPKLNKIIRQTAVLLSKTDARILHDTQLQLNVYRRNLAKTIEKRGGGKLTPALQWIDGQAGMLASQGKSLWTEYRRSHPLAEWVKVNKLYGAIGIASHINLDKVNDSHSFAFYAGQAGRMKGSNYKYKGPEKGFSDAAYHVVQLYSKYWRRRSWPFMWLVREMLSRALVEHQLGHMDDWQAKLEAKLRRRYGDKEFMFKHGRHLSSACPTQCGFQRAYRTGTITEIRPHLDGWVYYHLARKRSVRIILSHLTEASFVVEKGFRPYIKQDSVAYIEPARAHLIPGWNEADIKDWSGHESFPLRERGGVPSIWNTTFEDKGARIKSVEDAARTTYGAAT